MPDSSCFRRLRETGKIFSWYRVCPGLPSWRAGRPRVQVVCGKGLVASWCTSYASNDSAIWQRTPYAAPHLIIPVTAIPSVPPCEQPASSKTSEAPPLADSAPTAQCGHARVVSQVASRDGHEAGRVVKCHISTSNRGRVGCSRAVEHSYSALILCSVPQKAVACKECEVDWDLLFRKVLGLCISLRCGRGECSVETP